MKAKLERRKYYNNERAWIGKYQNLNNIEHWHIDHEIVLCVQGSCSIHCNNTSIPMHVGDAAIFASGMIHSITSKTNSILMVCIFDEHLDSGLFSYQRVVNPVFPASARLQDIFHHFYQVYKEKPKCYQIILSSLATIMCATIAQTQPMEKIDKAQYENIERYRDLLCWIDGHYNDLTFENAASVIGFTPAYFSRYFKRMSGMTFSQYVNSVRIENAIELLKTGNMTISAIANDTGFDCIRNFNRVFKSTTGYSPNSLPADYDFNLALMESGQDDFDPTLSTSILL